MTIKHIRWVACIGLLAIICLQYVWLVNTYKLTKESIQFRSNEVFRDATMREVFYRMEVSVSYTHLTLPTTERV